MRFIRVIAIRLAILVPTLLGLVTIMFFLTYYLPADPVAVAAGPMATPEQIETIKERYGFDQPIYVQYVRYIRDIVLRGDFGTSLYTHRSIREDLANRIPATLELALISLILGVFAGIVSGVVTATRRNGATDHLIRAISIAAISIAPFWIAIELQMIFNYKLRLLPLIGRITAGTQVESLTGLYLVDTLITGNWSAMGDACLHLVLPVVTLALVPWGIITRFSRAGMLGVLSSDYVLYARAMGVSHNKVVWKLALKNALVGTVAQVGLLFGFVLASTFVVEKIFMWPGIGAYALESILYLDFKVVFAVSLWAGVAYALGALLADVLQMVVDPREVSR